MIIGIIGVGVTGGCLEEWFKWVTPHEIRRYDPYKGYIDEMFDCDAVFICINIPTVQNAAYIQDLAPLVTSAKMCSKDATIFIRSTVLPGTCDEVAKKSGRKVYSMPEFLTERHANDDFDKQDIVTGCDSPLLLDKIFNHKKALYCMTNIEAEMVKYAHNCMGAVKVSYMNIIKDQCDKLGADYEFVKKGMLMSGYINDVHMDVPGPDGKYGFGGKCFPKDLKAFVAFTGNRYDLLSACDNDNRRFRKKS